MKNRITQVMKMIAATAIVAFMMLAPNRAYSQTKPCDASFELTTDGYKINVKSTANTTGAEYTWSYGDGTFGKNSAADHIYQKPGTYTVCLVVRRNSNNVKERCADSLCKTIEVKAPCKLAIQWDVALDGTLGRFKSAAQGGTDLMYHWDFGNGSTSDKQNPEFDFKTPGTYKVCLTVSTKDGKCKETTCKEVIVKEPCKMVIDYKFEIKGTTVVFTSGVQSNSTDLVYKWEFGNGGTSDKANPEFDFKTAGTYKVCLTVSSRDGKCSQTICKVVEIKRDPCADLKAEFRYEQAKDKAIFHSTTTGKDLTYEWTVDGKKVSDAESFGYIFKPGKHTICLTVHIKGTNCVSRICKEIEVKRPDPCEKLHATFKIRLADDKAQFRSTTEGNDLTYEWTINGRKVSDAKVFRFEFENPGKYTVCLTVHIKGTNCVSRECREIEVKIPCRLQAKFSYMVSGSKLLLHSETNGGAITHLWTVDGKAISKDENTLLKLSPGRHKVCLTVTSHNGRCTDTRCTEIEIKESKHTNTIVKGHNLTTETPVEVVNSCNCTTGNTLTAEAKVEMSLYPNPTSEMLNIDISGAEKVRVIISNTSGLEYYNAEHTVNGVALSLQVAHLPQGYYVAKVLAADGLHYATLKFYKQ